MKQKQASLIYLLFIVLLMIALIIFVYFNTKIDEFTEVKKQTDLLSILLILEGDEGILSSQVFFYHTKTGKGALLDIPPNTGSLISDTNKIASIETLYSSSDPSRYADKIAKMIDYPIHFYFTISDEQFIDLVDLLEGIDIFIPESINTWQEDVKIMIPSGSRVLDGTKALQYLSYQNDQTGDNERINRQQSIFQSLLRRAGRQTTYLLGDTVFPYLEKCLSGNMDSLSLQSFFAELESLDIDRLVFQKVLGSKKVVDYEELLFPHYDERLLKETVKQISESLSNMSIFSDEELIVSLEIQNGTSQNGLASRTSQIFKSYGYKISSVKNADNHNYQNTVVLDRTGSIESARKVAAVIRCSRVFSQLEENRDETVDVIIILGKDFDGRYVKE